MTDWISHNVGGCPVGHHVNVIVKYGSGERKTGMAGFFDWTIAGGKCGAVADIVEYQIVDAAPASTDWIEWNGGECPVAAGTPVDIRYRDGFVWDNVKALDDVNTDEMWAHESAFDVDHIFAYRLIDVPSELPEGNRDADSALTRQPGGTHYRDSAIQPVQFIEANKLGFLEGCIVKRAARHDKPTGKGREDIEKIIHEAQLLLELRYGAVV